MAEKQNAITETLTVFRKKEYLEHFNANYRGQSDHAKELEEFLKDRETGRAKVSYIPWAVLIRMATQQDPDFELEKVRNKDGSFLFYNGTELLEDVEFATYFVKVRATFFGKTIVEEYPVQDFEFEPVSFTGRQRQSANGRIRTILMDSNVINKSLQRASAKVISILTGLGLRLYETGDLQFEEDTEPGVPTTPAKTKKATTTKAPALDPSLSITPEQLAKIEELAKDEKTKLRLDKALSSYKVQKYSEFTKAQATTIIKALGKPAPAEKKKED